jgi:two-component system, NtrC family, response regulator HydG
MPRSEGHRGRVLIVDDEVAMADMLVDGLLDHGYEAVALASSEEAASRLGHEPFAALVTDLRMPKVDGLDLLTVARRSQPQMPVIVMTAYGAIDSAIESIRLGAFHYLTKPFKLDELVLFLDRALAGADLRKEAEGLKALLRDRVEPGVVCRSDTMRDAVDMIRRVASTSVSVLLLGETGTGKSLLARVLHSQSDRAERPFVTINCASLPEALLESELFGHARGAFTGAVRESPGLVEEANGGTLFLDEIAELALPLQAKLLDLVERRVVRAVGSSKERTVDVRLVAATNRDLAQRARSGAFREDLFYRLNVVTITLPPIRERREDLPELIEHFFALARARYPQSRVERIAAEAFERLLDHAWPGNVRELSHAIERAVLLAAGRELTVADLPAALRVPPVLDVLPADAVLPVREMQRRYAAWALEKMGGHRTRTADKLGVDLKTLAKWLGDSERESAAPELEGARDPAKLRASKV